MNTPKENERAGSVTRGSLAEAVCEAADRYLDAEGDRDDDPHGFDEMAAHNEMAEAVKAWKAAV